MKPPHRYIPYHFLLVFSTLLSSLTLLGQKNIEHQQILWHAYFLHIQLNEKWSWVSEIQERHFINPIAQHQWLLRTHIHRKLGDKGWEASAGMCLFYQNPHNPTATNKLSIPELRPHVELSYKQKIAKCTLDHRYQVEARFFHNTNDNRSQLTEGFAWGNFRCRYRLQATLPIWKFAENKSLKLKMSDEILLNVGKNITKNVFDQNRIYAALNADILTNLSLEIGYLNWFQQQTNGSSFYNRNIWRLVVLQKIVRPKKNNEPQQHH